MNLESDNIYIVKQLHLTLFLYCPVYTSYACPLVLNMLHYMRDIIFINYATEFDTKSFEFEKCKQTLSSIVYNITTLLYICLLPAFTAQSDQENCNGVAYNVGRKIAKTKLHDISFTLWFK